MTPLYHVAPVRLSAGSIIEPGNWGRLLNRYNTNGVGNGWIVARELVFEAARLVVAPHAPGRLSATFALESLEAATRYQTENDPNLFNIIHAVEHVDADAPTFVGHLEHIKWPAGSFLEGTRARAEAYWRGEGGGDREVVSLSPLRIIESY